ncbi:MAG: FtsX-like permease family protein, partial [Actinomycetia bacterium]|nr:FtsX-like permease family protein [Actinomycetes bacterium]
TTYDEEYAVRVLYDDIESDQQVWNMISGLILGAAALAAFNLINRIVEAQRREIGIGMALGVDRRKLAIRPMMIGLQVAIVGTVAGIGVGLLIGDAMKGLFNSFLPLPDYRTPFQFAVFARAALLAGAIPLLAAAVPVWRALRVEPIEAIRLGHLAAKQSRFGDWTGRLRLPGSTFTLMPVRNLVRTPRRTVLTALGVGAAVTTLVAVFGLLDTFGRTISLVGEELTGADRDRVVVQLDTFYPEGAGVVAAVEGSSAVEVADRGIRLPVVAAKRSEGDITMLIDLVDLDVARWQPTLLQGDGSDGLIVAEKAAEDLGIGVGDTVAVTHPTIDDSGQFGLDTSQLRVSGVHANPVRTFAYMDIGQASAFGMAGLTNLITVYPPEGLTWIDIQRDLFGSEGVSSVQGMARLGDSFDEYLEEFVSILLVAAGAVLVLALLISFNATRITVDERRREHATMRAFGLPVRSVLFGVVKESVLIGVLATLIGIAGGYAFLTWMVSTLMETTVPELSMQARLSVATLGWAALVGIAAMAIAPLFVIRRLHKMNIPDTLRVME